MDSTNSRGIRKGLAALILVLSAGAAHAGLGDVLAAEQAVEQAKAAKKAAEKGLSKVERAQLRLIRAQQAYDKALGADVVDMPVQPVRGGRKAVQS